MSDLGPTLLALAPILAIGAFLPTWTLYVLILMGTRRPLANGLAFVAGNATFRMALGIAALSAVHLPKVTLGGGGSRQQQAVQAAVLGTLFLALAVAQWRQRNASTGTAGKVVDLLQRTPPALSFVLGFGLCAAPGAQWLYQLAAVSVIQDLDVGRAAQFLWLAAVVLVLEAMLLAPLVIYVVDRPRADVVLGRFRDWLQHNAARAAAYVLGTIGGLLLVRAVWLALA